MTFVRQVIKISFRAIFMQCLSKEPAHLTQSPNLCQFDKSSKTKKKGLIFLQRFEISSNPIKGRTLRAAGPRPGFLGFGTKIQKSDFGPLISGLE